MRLTVSLAASYNWPLLDLDVRSAFLNGDLKETMYMEVLDNFCDSTTGTKVCCLKNSLFGLKQAPRVWFEKINTFFSTDSQVQNLTTTYIIFGIQVKLYCSYYMLTIYCSQDQTGTRFLRSKLNSCKSLK